MCTAHEGNGERLFPDSAAIIFTTRFTDMGIRDTVFTLFSCVLAAVSFHERFDCAFPYRVLSIIAHSSDHLIEVRYVPAHRTDAKNVSGRFAVVECPAVNCERAGISLVEVPDIPTHDLAGTPPPARDGLLVQENEGNIVWLILAKASGFSIVMRAYSLQMERDIEAPRPVRVEIGKPVETEVHIESPVDSLDLSVLNVEQDVVVIRLDSKKSNKNGPVVRLNTKRKKFLLGNRDKQ